MDDLEKARSCVHTGLGLAMVCIVLTGVGFFVPIDSPLAPVVGIANVVLAAVSIGFSITGVVKAWKA